MQQTVSEILDFLMANIFQITIIILLVRIEHVIEQQTKFLKSEDQINDIGENLN